MSSTTPTALVSGGNVVAPVAVNKKKYYRLSYLRGTGRGAKRVNEVFLLAKAQGFEFSGTWEYKKQRLRYRLIMFNFTWGASEASAKALDEALIAILKKYPAAFDVA